MNKVMLIGNVGAEPAVRYLDQGVCVAEVRLATTERGYTLQNGTQVPDRTEWHRIIFWRRQAEIVEQYVHKGDKLYVEGKIQSRTYDDRQGVRHTVVEIMADGLELLSPKPANSGNTAQSAATAQPTQPSAPVQPTAQPSTAQPAQNEEELPF